MKKFTQILLAAVLSISLVGVGNVANAFTCESIVINNTGPGSNNEATCFVEVNVEVICNNNIYVLNDNSQSAVSGAVTNQGNTTGGAAISGNATNENGDTVTIGATCGAQPTTPIVTTTTPTTTVPTTPLAPVVPGKGAAVLPNTSSNSVVEIALLGVAAIAGLLVASRIVVAAYRHRALK